ncbi:hypothetical protein M501DRAFT_375749 [Patellaria atrata CBS 101060]|uniref:Nephrocystin 3-like N-terminal domain-containing protein n=1 Tax=Patellaria atrata CBS 101060 TaxID=1346257 RepID=A0A9P4SHP5_9PEZI|nr:hypothetical protein M501DRAFT_375749 [Patellaria atrata CBS 101060]
MAAQTTAIAIIHFLYFAIRLLDQRARTYKSPLGVESKRVQLSQVFNDLNVLVSKLEPAIKDPGLPLNAIPLLTFRKECKTIASELLKCLEDLQARDITEWNCAKKTFLFLAATVWGKEKPGATENRLWKLKMRADRAILQWLCFKQIEHDATQEQAQNGNLPYRDEALEVISRDFANGMRKFAGQDFIRSAGRSGIDRELLLSDLILALYRANFNIPDSYCIKCDVCCESVVSSLNPGISEDTRPITRLESEGYFQWLLNNSTTYEDGSSSILDWLLTDGEQTYLLIGTQGSGKTTLIRYLSQSKEGRSNLQRHISGPFLLAAVFCPRNSKFSGEASATCIIRTVLHQLLQQKPDLIGSVCPKRWTLTKLFGPNVQAPLWSGKELTNAMADILKATSRSIKILVLLDGVDGLQDRGKGILNLLDEWRMEFHLKVLLTSRPNTKLLEQYDTQDIPHLQLEQYMDDDIHNFVVKKLSANNLFAKLQEEHLESSLTTISNICKRSNGIMLIADLMSEYILLQLSENGELALSEKIMRCEQSWSHLSQGTESLLEFLEGKFKRRGDSSNSAQLPIEDKPLRGPENAWLVRFMKNVFSRAIPFQNGLSTQ